MDADVILNEVGGFGLYQKRLLIVLWIIAVFNAWPWLSVVFTHYVPEYQCSYGNYYNSSNTTEYPDMVAYRNSTSVLDKKNTSCIVSMGTSSNQTTLCSDWIFNTENDGGETVVSQMNLVCDKEWILPTILSISMAGGAMGVGMCGTLADRFGRRPVYLGSSIVLFAATLGMAFSNEIITYGIFLTIMGVSESIQYLIICVLGSEMIDPKHRQFAVLSVLSGYIFGYVTLPLLAFLANDWRTLLYVTCVGNCAFAIGYWHCPETVRWLILKRDWKRTEILVAEIARVNKRTSKRDYSFKKDAFENLTENEEREKRNVKGKGASLIKNSTMFIRLLVSISIWCVTSFVYYAILLNTSFLQGDRYINCLISALLEIPSIVLGHLLMGKFGRVKTNFVFFIVSGLALIAARLVARVSSIAVTVFAIGGKTAVTGAFYVIYVHAVEIAPTLNRGLFLNACSASASIGSVLSPYLMYTGRTDAFETIMFMLMGISSIFAGVLTLLFLPETVGKALPDTIEEATTLKTLRAGRKQKNEVWK